MTTARARFDCSFNSFRVRIVSEGNCSRIILVGKEDRQCEFELSPCDLHSFCTRKATVVIFVFATSSDDSTREKMLLVFGQVFEGSGA
jgi:hypothetical protein